MTGDPYRAPRFTFVDTLDPLPLVTPSAAAAFLDVERHTLACYRSLGDGPAYFKFGRWIRYTRSDLRSWTLNRDCAEAPWPPELLRAIDSNRATVVDAQAAARFLTVSRFCLNNYRAQDSGPSWRRFGRRIYYSVDALWSWVQSQRWIPSDGQRSVSGGGLPKERFAPGVGYDTRSY